MSSWVLAGLSDFNLTKFTHCRLKVVTTSQVINDYEYRLNITKPK